MLELYFVYNGHCKFYLGTFDNVDDLIEQMEDHQWAFSAITHPRFQKHIGQRTTRFDYGSKDCYHSAGKCNYLGKRICIFCEQVKKNNYITLHKSMLEKIIKTMESFTDAEQMKGEEND
ncbi:phage protein [Streptococcus pneumoniae]|nr:phage protein [Streptococcus pneumoniae]